MKKVIFSFLAVAALASCVKEQTLNTLAPAEIGFAGSFVENATRANDPSTTTASINEMYVWAVMDQETGIVFDDETVSKNGSEWTYVNTQYWTPNHTYYFSALAGDRTNDQIVIDLAAAADNGMSVDGLGTVTFTNIDGTNDVLYAESERTTGAAITSQPEDVKFQFAHLLSKVKFSFVNGFVNDNNTIVVKNIKMVVPAKGTIDLTADSFVWENLAETVTLDMGNMSEGARVAISQTASSDNERLTIPAAATQEYTVTFDVELYMGDVLASSASKTVKINGCVLEPGKAYNFKATINEQNVDENPLFPITFDAVVDEWIEAPVYDGGVIPTNAVSTAEELAAAVAKGGLVTLARNIDLPQTLTLDQNVATTIDLNGKNITIANQSSDVAVGDGIIVTAGKLTIKGEGTVTANTRTVWARGEGNAEIVIEGGNYVGANGFTTEVIYASGNGKIAIYGGTFEAVTIDEKSFAAPQYAVLNLHGNGATGNDIKVYGGTFKNFNPADNVSENPKYNFCAEGYSSVEYGEYFVVAKAISTVAEMAEAFNTLPVVNVAAPIDNGSNVTNIRNNDVVINMEGNSIKAGGQGTNNYAFNLFESTVEVNNANLDGAGFAVLDGSELTVNNSTIAAKPGKSGRNMFYVVGNSTVTVNEGTYTFDRTSCYFVYVEAGSTCIINGGHYEKPLANNASKDSFVNSASAGTVIITGGTFNVDPTNWVADGYQAVKNGRIWTVSAK